MPSAWIALAVLALLAPTLARTPQSGDSAEIVTVAIQGGVLHPTGFPLQAWIDRLLVSIPGITPAMAIAGLGLVAHAGAAGLIAASLRLLGVATAGRMLGAAAFALFPSLWTVAVEPEVFALAHLVLAATLWAAIRLRTADATHGVRAGVRLGLLGAAAVAQHPVALAGLPALAIAALRGQAHRIPRTAAFATTLVVGAALAYASLPLLRTRSPWPDWGQLASARDVVAHALRLDYGAFSLSAAQSVATLSALTLWVRELLTWWNVGLLLVLVGAWQLATRRESRWRWAPIATTLLAGIAILWRGRLPEQSYSDAYLEKLQGPATIAAAVLLGLGAQWLADRLGPRRRALDAAVIAASLAWLVLGWPRADAADDRTLALYARGVGDELPADAVYVTEGEVEAFLGAPTPHGTRFPISNPLTSLSWYVRDVAPRLEPRVLQGAPPLEDWDQFLTACLEKGLPVASTSPGIVTTPFGMPELRGLLYVARAGGREELTDETIAAAVDLAPLTRELPALRPGTRPFSRFYVRRFARAYAGAAEALRRRGSIELAAEADSIAASLDRGLSRRTRAARLAEFVAQARAAGLER